GAGRRQVDRADRRPAGRWPQALQRDQADGRRHFPEDAELHAARTGARRAGDANCLPEHAAAGGLRTDQARQHLVEGGRTAELVGARSCRRDSRVARALRRQERGVAPMRLFSDPSFLSSVGQLLVVLGLVGQVSLFFFPAARRLLERSLGVLFTVVAIGGVGLTWRAQDLRDADRNLTPVQQAALGQAISQFPTVKYEVFAAGDDKEARALALKIIDAVKAGGGSAPAIEDLRSAPLGVGVVGRA